LKVEVAKGSVTYVNEQEFQWGLVSLNTKKSIYKPGDNAEFIIVTLDRDGHPECNADISLSVNNPDGEETTYSTGDGTITASNDCGIYTANYPTEIEGNHTIGITALIDGIEVSFNTYFMVQKEYEFEIVRTAQSKIDPTKQDWFNVIIDIKSLNTASSVTIKEFVPAEFTIVSDATGIVQEDDTKILIWDNELIENKTSVNYSYAVPHIWPYLYALGPVKIDYEAQTFKEARPWYVAVDPAPNISLNNPPNGSTTTNSWALLNATVTDPGNDTMTVYFYANNNSNGLNASEGLVYIAENVENGTTLTYNLTALPINPADDGLALLMHFDNLSDYGENNTHVYDFSGDGNNGTCKGVGEPNWTSNGKFGGAFEFDGADDWFRVEGGANFRSSDTEGTIMAWIKPISFGEYSYVFCSADASTNEYLFNFAIEQTTGNPYIYQRNAADTADYIEANNGVAANEWNHVAWVSDGTSYSIYINGVNQSLTINSGNNSGDWFADTN